jgi:hypothetical protein
MIFDCVHHNMTGLQVEYRRDSIQMYRVRQKELPDFGR